jgi:hypothetical protein
MSKERFPRLPQQLALAIFAFIILIVPIVVLWVLILDAMKGAAP